VINKIIFGAGCFWGVEHAFSLVPGVVSVKSGYSGGEEESASYKEVCSGTTKHIEAVLVEYDDSVTLEQLLSIFWNIHDPTQLARQGNDLGTQYQSAIFYYTNDQFEIIEASKNELKQSELVTTIIKEAPPFYDAEEYHQKYLMKNPTGYCHINFALVKELIAKL